jgi:hypothetical protein
MEEKVEEIPKAWEEMCNAPQGYPIEVYKGGLEKRNAQGNILDSRWLNASLCTGFEGWGASGGGMSRSWFVPTHLNCIWLSYAENTFYKIDCAIDHDKMLKLFQEGYPNSMWFRNDGSRVKDYFNSIITGFAPGGVVVIWLAGANRQVEIGRYKGVKYTVDPKEIAGLEQETHVLFEQEFRDGIMSDPNVVPPKVQQANKNKPIPYGLWDTLRIRYLWRPVFEAQDDGVFYFVYFEMVNGEKEDLFDISLKENRFTPRALPSLFNIYWKDRTGQRYGANDIEFDKQEIATAYKELFKEDKEAQAELVFTVNHANSFITVLLRSGDKKIRLPKTKINVYKASK